MNAAITLPSPADLAAFCERHHIRRLAVFGSALTDRLRPDSDIDLLVEFESPERTPGFFTLAGIEFELSDLFGGRRVDLRTKEDLSPYFRDRVVAEAEVLYLR